MDSDNTEASTVVWHSTPDADSWWVRVMAHDEPVTDDAGITEGGHSEYRGYAHR